MGKSWQKKNTKPKPNIKGKCRDCGLVQVIQVREFYHSSGARCGACGGRLDKAGRRNLNSGNKDYL